MRGAAGRQGRQPSLAQTTMCDERTMRMMVASLWAAQTSTRSRGPAGPGWQLYLDQKRCLGSCILTWTWQDGAWGSAHRVRGRTYIHWRWRRVRNPRRASVTWLSSSWA